MDSDLRRIALQNSFKPNTCTVSVSCSAETRNFTGLEQVKLNVTEKFVKHTTKWLVRLAVWCKISQIHYYKYDTRKNIFLSEMPQKYKLQRQIVSSFKRLPWDQDVS